MWVKKMKQRGGNNMDDNRNNSLILTTNSLDAYSLPSCF